MRPIKQFKEYIEEGIVQEKTVDISRGRSLKKESEKTESFLREIINVIKINDDNANNVIKLTYDVIMEHVRAEMLLKSYTASGQGAHEAEVAYLRELNFTEKEVQFCDQLRYFRNGILYYGKKFNKDYAEKTIQFLNKFKEKLVGE